MLYFFAQMLKRGEVVKGRWRIEQRLGKGTFCELHRARDLTREGEGAAVKVEVQGMQRSVLKVRIKRFEAPHFGVGNNSLVLRVVLLPAKKDVFRSVILEWRKRVV